MGNVLHVSSTNVRKVVVRLTKANGLYEERWKFLLIANYPLPVNPLPIAIFCMPHGEIFKVRSPIGSFLEKCENIPQRTLTFIFEYKDSDMFAKVQYSL